MPKLLPRYSASVIIPIRSKEARVHERKFVRPPRFGVRGCLRLRAEWWGAKILYMHSQRNPRPTVHVFSGDPEKPDIDSIWTSTG